MKPIEEIELIKQRVERVEDSINMLMKKAQAVMKTKIDFHNGECYVDSVKVKELNVWVEKMEGTVIGK